VAPHHEWRCYATSVSPEEPINYTALFCLTGLYSDAYNDNGSWTNSISTQAINKTGDTFFSARQQRIAHHTSVIGTC
jgi:hypothetical protein